jgi:hypothetical protein
MKNRISGYFIYELKYMEGIPKLTELMAEMLLEQRQTNVRLESMDNRMDTKNKRLESL